MTKIKMIIKYIKKSKRDIFYKFLKILTSAIWIDFFFLVIDYADISNVIQNNITNYLIRFPVILIIIYVAIKLFITKKYKYLILVLKKNLNSILVSIMIYNLHFIIVNKYSCIKYMRIFEIIGELILVICFFIINLKKIIKIVNNKNKKSYILKDLYDNKIIINQNEVVIFNETDKIDNEENISDIDDFYDRKSFINNIEDIINNAEYDDKLVISIEGKWGCGKTTILNRLEKKDAGKNVFISDFEPWLYNDTESLVIGLLDCIMKKIDGIQLDYLKMKNIKKYIIKSFFEFTDKGIYDFVDGNHSMLLQKSYKEYQNLVEEYLKKQNKKVVLVLDNLARTETEKIVLLCKYINEIFNFKGFIYILSFDPDQLKRNFEKNNINYEYIKKFIQIELQVPQIDKGNLIDVNVKCICNLLNLYKIENYELKDIETVSEYITDGRILKKVLNSSISSACREKKCINVVYQILLDILRMEDIELYYSIWENREFYLNILPNYRSNSNTSYEQKYFNKIKNILSIKNERIKRILLLMFPELNKMLDDIWMPVCLITEKYNLNNKTYFNNYYISNNYYHNEIITYIINPICNKNLSTQLKNEIEKKYRNIMKTQDGVVNFFNIINTEINQFYNRYILFKIMIDNYEFVTNSFDNDEIQNFQKEFCLLMSKILLESDIEYLNNCSKYFKRNYKYLNIFRHIIICMKEKSDNNRNINFLEKKFNDIILRIFKNKINLYDIKNYSKNNIWCFYEYLEANEDNEKNVRNYMKNILSNNNIVRFINDFITYSYDGKKYKYYIDEDIEKFASKNTILNILKKINTNKLDYKQKWVIDLYNGGYIKEKTTNNNKQMKDTLTKLSTYELQILDYLSKNGEATRREMLQDLGINENMGIKIITNLIASGIVEVKSDDKKFVIRNTDKF